MSGFFSNYGFLAESMKALAAAAVLCSCVSVVFTARKNILIGQGFSAAAYAGIALSTLLGLGADDIVCPIVAAIAAALLLCYFDETGVEQNVSVGMAIILFLSAGTVFFSMIEGYVPSLSIQMMINPMCISAIDKLIMYITLLLAAVAAIFYNRQLMVFMLSYSGDAVQQKQIKSFKYILYIISAVIVAITSKICGFLFANSFLVCAGSIAAVFARDFKAAFIIAAVFGVVSAAAGFIIAAVFDFPPEPMIALMQFAGLCIILTRKGR